MFKLFCSFCLAASWLCAATPAERSIEQARTAIAQDGARPDAYSRLAIALARRARETGDPKYYDRAQAAIDTSLALEPDNFDALKARAWTLLGKHEFVAALELARKLNKRMPDDPLIYGFIADANVELGNYGAAEKAVQWMLDLRPGNVPALTRGAYLRELFGDIEGALDFMTQAYYRTRPEDSEDRAWILTQIGHLHLSKGSADKAERSLNAALKLFPDYHYALGALAKVRLAQRDFPGAVALLRTRYQLAPHPENLFELAVALDRAGLKDDAGREFAAFEEGARREMDGPDNANRELIFYYLEYSARPGEALRIAEREAAVRRDVFTLDAYAWALHKSGRHEEAKKALDKALAVGISDSSMLFHAGSIALSLSDKPAASKLLTQALRVNPAFPSSEEARKLLVQAGTAR